MAYRVSQLLRGLLEWALPRALRLRPVPVVVRVGAAVAACYALSAASAHATCGDWLAHPEPPAIEEAVDQPADDASDATTPNEDQGSKPCSGPFCDEAPQLPAAPVPAPVPTVVDQFASLQYAAEGDCRDSASSGRADERVAALPGFLMPIEHPPRG
jgi:hypothetical protein